MESKTQEVYRINDYGEFITGRYITSGPFSVILFSNKKGDSLYAQPSWGTFGWYKSKEELIASIEVSRKYHNDKYDKQIEKVNAIQPIE